MKTIIIYNGENYNNLVDAQNDHADYSFQVPDNTDPATIRVILSNVSEMLFNSANNIKAFVIVDLESL